VTETVLVDDGSPAMASSYAEWHRRIMAKEYPEGSPCWHIQRQAPLRSSSGVRYFKLCEDPGCLVKHDDAQPWTIAPDVIENLPPAE